MFYVFLADRVYAGELLESCKKRHQQNEPFNNILNSDEEIGALATQSYDVDEGLLGESGQLQERHFWTYDETKHLIACVGSHYEELQHQNPKTKKKGWENIANDLLSLKITVTVTEIKKKWGNLVQSYNKSKDIKKKTGRGPSRFNFFNEIDDVLGNKPSNSSPHSFDIGKVERQGCLSQKKRKQE